MPQIKSGDPAVKVIGAKPGDVLKSQEKAQLPANMLLIGYVCRVSRLNHLISQPFAHSVSDKRSTILLNDS